MEHISFGSRVYRGRVSVDQILYFQWLGPFTGGLGARMSHELQPLKATAPTSPKKFKYQPEGWG